MSKIVMTRKFQSLFENRIEAAIVAKSLFRLHKSRSRFSLKRKPLRTIHSVHVHYNPEPVGIVILTNREKTHSIIKVLK